MNNSSFIPEDYMQKRSQRRINAIFFTLFLFVIGAVAIGIFMTKHRQVTLDARKTQQDNEISSVQESLETLQQIESRRSRVMEKARLSAALVEPIPQSLLIALVTNRLPENVSLAYYKIETREVQRQMPQSDEPTNRRSRRRRNTEQDDEKQSVLPPEYRTTVELRGLARSDMLVAHFVENLNDSTLLEQVNLHYSREDRQSDGSLLREFKITARISPGREATEVHVNEARFMTSRNDTRSETLNQLSSNK